MKKRDIPKMKSLVRTAAEDGYVRKIVEEADAVLQRFELEQELTAAARCVGVFNSPSYIAKHPQLVDGHDVYRWSVV